MSSAAHLKISAQEGPMPEWLSRLWYEGNRCFVMAAISMGFSLRFQGGRNIPRRGPVLLVANHQSFIDPLAIGLATPRQLFYLARKTLFNQPQFGQYLRSVGCVAVDQEGFARDGIKATLELLKEGKAVLVFPEGERTWTGAMQALKPGIHLIMKKSAVPVVPVGIAGAFDAYPRTKALPQLAPAFLPATKATVAVSVGRAINPDDYAKLPRETVLEKLYHQIAEQHRRAENLRRKPGTCQAG